MADKRYIGITVGPIFDTMNMSSSPLALWASSYMFSTLSKTLCRLIVESGVSEEDIISPFYSVTDEITNKNDGVGLFNDRIIFCAESFDEKKIKDIKAEAINELADLINIPKEYLEGYVMISSVVFAADSPLEKGNIILDNSELKKNYIYKEETSPLLNLFNGNRRCRNSELLNTRMITDLASFQLRDEDGSVKSLTEIISTGTGYKKYKYYAIVRSDGDNMGKIAQAMKTNEEAREFSKVCLEYCSEIAGVVKDFDGVTIYSGGDDLLAILPCESLDGKNPFDFAARAQEIFANHFDKYKKGASLSFGILIAYNKSPLFEALEESERLLFSIAKKDKKSRLALKLQRSSGQTEGLIIANDKLDILIDVLKHIKDSCSHDENTGNMMLSASDKFNLFEYIFNGVDNQEDIENTIWNIFDTKAQRNSLFFHTLLPQFIQSAILSGGITALTDNRAQINNPAMAVRFVLRICKFLINEGGDE